MLRLPNIGAKDDDVDVDDDDVDDDDVDDDDVDDVDELELELALFSVVFLSCV